MQFNSIYLSLLFKLFKIKQTRQLMFILSVFLAIVLHLSAHAIDREHQKPLVTKKLSSIIVNDHALHNATLTENTRRYLNSSKHHHKKSTNASNSTNSNLNKPFRFKKNKKRCRYSENQLEQLDNNDNGQLNRPLANKSNYNPFGYVKSQRVRDQYQNKVFNSFDSSSTDINSDMINNLHEIHNSKNHHHHHHHSGSNANNEQIESESVFVNVGDTINLTCIINTREVDWHFKDKNLTTTILSYGLQLQVRQPIIYDLNDYNTIKYSDYNNNNNQNFESNFNEQLSIFKRNEPIIKYKLSSDLEYTHMLTLYIQGSQDEGSYQCVDSKSDSPIKKTIRVSLSN
jgi:hypothetical protein